MMNTHPKIFLWMVAQDRELAQTRQALERAARSGGEDRPGLARGGISLAGALRRAAASLRLRPGRSGQTSHLTGSSGV